MNRYTKHSSTFLHWCIAGWILLCCGACTKNFLNDNTNPNNVTTQMLQYDNLAVGAFFPQLEKNVFPAGNNSTVEVNEYQTAQNLMGDVYSGYMGASDNWYGSSNSTTYNLITAWYGQAFSNAFTGVMPAWRSIQQQTQLTHPDVYAVAQIIKVEAMHRATDIYGPLPYFRFGASGLFTPYDPQDSIYYSFFKDLDSAITTLSQFVQAYPGQAPLAAYDLVYAGNYVEWIKFANSLKLRLAMHIVYASPDSAQKYAEAAVNNAYGVLATNADNALLQSGNGIIINNPIWWICYNYNDIRMGANMESFLTGYQDPRVAAWFNAATLPSGGYHGIRNGINMPNIAPYGTFSTLNMTISSPLQWMAAPEMYFLKAEGALRGWNMGGTAQSFYQAGIQMSFTQTNEGDATTYMSDNSSTAAPYTDPENPVNNIGQGSNLSTVTIQWDAGASFETNLERIITQKWIAMYPDGQEAWTEFRRTGYPKVFPVVVNNSGGTIGTTEQIRRIPFPQTEYQSNSSGVKSGVAELDGPDNGGTKLWWDQKP